MAPNRGLVFHVCLDAILIVAVVVLAIWISSGSPPRIEQGFFCDDPALQYPMLDETLPTWIGMIIVSLNIIVFFVRELVWWACVCRETVPCYMALLKACRTLVVYGVGFGITQFMLETIKATVGKLRPDFMDACKPNVTEADCAKGYISTFECTNPELGDLRHEMSRSFPSGHATQAAYVGTFMVCYLDQRLPIPFSTFLKPIIQTAFVSVGLFSAFSRVSDHKHDMTDVLVGIVIGILMGLAIFQVIKKDKELGDISDKDDKETWDDSTSQLPLLGSDTGKVKDHGTFNVQGAGTKPVQRHSVSNVDTVQQHRVPSVEPHSYENSMNREDEKSHSSEHK